MVKALNWLISGPIAPILMDCQTCGDLCCCWCARLQRTGRHNCVSLCLTTQHISLFFVFFLKLWKMISSCLARYKAANPSAALQGASGNRAAFSQCMTDKAQCTRIQNVSYNTFGQSLSISVMYIQLLFPEQLCLCRFIQ